MEEEEKESYEPKFVFRINDNGQGLNYLRQICLERGWDEFQEHRHTRSDVNMWWRSTRFRARDHENVNSWQRLNHFSVSSGITKKDCLARNVRRMKAVHGSHIYNFTPTSFNLPNDYTKFVAEYTRMRQLEDSRHLLWICKPADLSRGRGIFIFRDLADCQYNCNAVVQRYITEPFLISGYKFDLRIYVVVPCYDPLTIYIHREGLVRFSTAKYNLDLPANVYSHLTNTSLNKNSPAYLDKKERVGYGCKWSLSALYKYFLANDIDARTIWPRISNIVILTIIMQIPQVPKYNNCFELYGFDILLDETLKPWLLEVNFSPSLSIDTDIDVTVKRPLLNDIIDLMQFKKSDAYRGNTSRTSNNLPLTQNDVKRVDTEKDQHKPRKDCYCFVINSEENKLDASVSAEQSRKLEKGTINDTRNSKKKSNANGKVQQKPSNKNKIAGSEGFNGLQSSSIQNIKREMGFTNHDQVKCLLELSASKSDYIISESTSIECDLNEQIGQGSSGKLDSLLQVESDKEASVISISHITKRNDNASFAREILDLDSPCLELTENFYDCADFQPVIVPGRIQRKLFIAENQIELEHLHHVDGEESGKIHQSEQFPDAKSMINNCTSVYTCDECEQKEEVDQLKMCKNSLMGKDSARTKSKSCLKTSFRSTLFSGHAPKSVGGLQCIYPFNEVSRCLRTGDIRAIIRETQRQLRKQLSEISRKRGK